MSKHFQLLQYKAESIFENNVILICKSVIKKQSL